jgi:hypothetical protein
MGWEAERSSRANLFLVRDITGLPGVMRPVRRGESERGGPWGAS